MSLSDKEMDITSSDGCSTVMEPNVQRLSDQCNNGCVSIMNVSVATGNTHSTDYMHSE